MKRIQRTFYGTAFWIAPREGGALAQCAFCESGRFFEDRKRKRYSAVVRAAASLRVHAKRMHADKFLKISTAAEILADQVK
jgi:hypothetical protein